MLINNGTGALWIKRLLPYEVVQSISANSVEVSPAQPAEQDLFLFVLQVTDANLTQDSPEVVADQAIVISDDNYLGVKFYRWKVLFNMNDTLGVSVIINDPPAFINLSNHLIGKSFRGFCLTKNRAYSVSDVSP